MDWLAYTLPDDCDLEDGIPGGDEVEWTLLERGSMGYRRSAEADGVRVYWDGQPGMGKHVVISGSAARQLEASGRLNRYDVGGWTGWLRKIRRNGWNITRQDLAIDDRNGALDMARLGEAIEDESYTSRWQSVQEQRSRRRRGEGFGVTYYFGSRSSDFLCRVYDKAAQLEAKGEETDGRPWVRVELQARDRHAEALADLLVNCELNVGPILQMLHGHLDFKEPRPGDSNRRRWPTADWWAAFLDFAGKKRLGVAPRERSLEAIYAWIRAQVAPSVALMVRAHGGNWWAIRQLLIDGEARLKPRHLALLPATAAGG